MIPANGSSLTAAALAQRGLTAIAFKIARKHPTHPLLRDGDGGEEFRTNFMSRIPTRMRRI